MSDHGQNAPPFEAISFHIEDLFQTISDSTSGGKAETAEQEAQLDSLMDDLRQAKKAADAERAAEKKPHADAAKAVDDKWRDVLKRCDAGIDHLKGLLTPFREARQRAKDEAAAKARQEAQQRQEAAVAALRQSEDLEAKFAAEEELKQAQKLAAAVNRIDREATGLRTQHVAEVTDRRALLEHVMRNDPEPLTDWLSEYARKALPRALPGVTIRIERRAA